MKFIFGWLLLAIVHTMSMIIWPQVNMIHLVIWLMLIGGLGLAGWRSGWGKSFLQIRWRNILPWHFWLVVAVALLLRLPWLDAVPANVGGDEMSQALAAKQFAAGEDQNFFGLNSWYFTPNFYYAITGLIFTVFEPSVWSWRLTSVIFGVATVGLTYFWGRVLAGWRVGFLAGLVLAGSHFHIHFSRLGAHQITDAFWAVLVLLLLTLAIKYKWLMGLVLAGAGAGIGLNFYFGARLIPVIAVISLGGAALSLGRRWGLRASLLFLAGFWIGWYPFGLTQLGAPEQFMSRVNQVVMDDPWTIERLIERVSIGFRVLVNPELTQWYIPPIGILSWLSFGWLVVGWLTLWRLGGRERGGKWQSTGKTWTLVFPLLLLASLPLLTVALLIDHPVASQRIVMITPALSMIIAWGIWVVSGRLLKAKWGWVLAVFLVVECMLIDSWIYFIRYTPERTYGGINGVVASELVRLKTAPAETRVVFFGPGRMWYHSFSNVAFEMPHLIGVNVEEGEVYEHLEEGTLYVALPERVEELASVVAQDIREENVLVVWFEQPVSLRERLAFYTDEDRGVRIGEMSRLETEMGVEGGTVLFYVYDPERRWVF